MSQKIKDSVFLAVISLLLFSPIIAWLTHVITCIQTEKWLLLLAGAIMFPIGILHGFGLWIGVF
jgi:predicted neutral ceramidase superfamily lipid hydrolase